MCHQTEICKICEKELEYAILWKMIVFVCLFVSDNKHKGGEQEAKNTQTILVYQGTGPLK